MTMIELTDSELDLVAGGVGYDLASGYGTVTAGERGSNGSLQYPFSPGTVVPSQAAASYYNPSFVADGQYTAGLSPYGNGSPVGNVGNS